MSQDWKFTLARRPLVPSSADCGSSRRSFLSAGATAAAAIATSAVLPSFAHAAETKFKRVPTQYIAALGDRDATAGNDAQRWGLWRQDPGPRGVRLGFYELLNVVGGLTPAGWRFDPTDWWLEEHGLIMEKPEFPLPAGKYQVTGNRNVTAALTVHLKDDIGGQRWELADGATLYDVTHLGCRSARYLPVEPDSCSPAKAPRAAFPVAPGGAMPPIEGCRHQDYSVLIVTAVAEEG